MVPICCKVSPYSGDPCRRKYGGAFKSGMLLPQRFSSWDDVVFVTCPTSLSAYHSRDLGGQGEPLLCLLFSVFHVRGMIVRGGGTHHTFGGSAGL